MSEERDASLDVDQYGTKRWYRYGQLHRWDGPAVEWAEGTKLWFLHGVQVTEEEHKRRMSAKARGQE